MMKFKNFDGGRRKFITSLGVLGLAGLFPVYAIGRNKEKSKVNELSVLKTGPYLQFNEKGGITVRWMTNVPCFCWIEYGIDNTLGKKAVTKNAGLLEAYNTIHAINIEALEQGQKYYYRICSKVIKKFEPYNVVYGETYTSEVFTFKLAANDDNVSFLVFNDIHDRSESYSHLMQFTKKGKADFIFLNGDIFSHLEEEEQIVSNLLNPLSSVTTHIPLVFSRGNHETRGKFARQLTNYFNYGKDGLYFSFMLGSVYCIVLDSGEDKPDDTKEYAGLVDFDTYRLAQREWLKNEIKKKKFKKAKYKIVFSHIPLFYSNDWHGPLHCRKAWADVLNKAEIDLMICGHTHIPGIYPKVEGLHNYPIVIGGGPKDGNRTIMEIEADKNFLQLKMSDDSGILLGELTI